MKTIIQFTSLLTSLVCFSAPRGGFENIEYKAPSKAGFQNNAIYFFTKYLSQSC